MRSHWSLSSIIGVLKLRKSYTETETHREEAHVTGAEAGGVQPQAEGPQGAGATAARRHRPDPPRQKGSPPALCFWTLASRASREHMLTALSRLVGGLTYGSPEERASVLVLKWGAARQTAKPPRWPWEWAVGRGRQCLEVQDGGERRLA